MHSFQTVECIASPAFDSAPVLIVISTLLSLSNPGHPAPRCPRYDFFELGDGHCRTVLNWDLILLGPGV